VLFSLFLIDIPTSCCHVELAQYADVVALVVTSHSPSLLVSYLETCLSQLERWLQDWRSAINVWMSTTVLFVKIARSMQIPSPLSFSESQYSGSKQHGILGWPLVHSLPGWYTPTRYERRQLSDWVGMLDLLNRRSCVSITNGVLLYKQLICPVVDYSCLIWTSAACSHVRKLHMLQSKCLCIATNAPWYFGKRKIHKDLGIPLFADHIRALTESLDSKLADAGNPSVRQLGRHFCPPRGD
jgi:hypothetical protein